MSSRLRPHRCALFALVTALLLTGCTSADAPGRAALPTNATPSPTVAVTPVPQSQSAIHHVFVIVLENSPYAQSYGPGSKYAYLSQTLRRQGTLLSQYYGTAHYSLGNYLAMIGGVAPNKDIQLDCGHYRNMISPRPAADGQVKASTGCIYPAWTPTLVGQLADAHLTWRGYLEDMGNLSGREQATCGKPGLGPFSADRTQKAAPGDAYTARHNPFLYFTSVVDTAACAQNVGPLPRLTGDLASAATTANFSFIVPSLCNDGHDATCVGQPAGPEAEDAWLATWVPRITASPAFRADGALIIVNDEADGDSSACCREPSGPNVAYPGGPVEALKSAPGGGKGGGRIGALILSPFVRADATSSTPYNHYSLLRSIEDIFGLRHLGYADQPTLRPFGSDVWLPAARTG
ncbi:alkaline phosphatase family protein [Rathayibacter soli]|uniref:alkaline phosphatase family protein n=1 Tax=Rathayibacter soli TaxID=3144168 RepID=UPI0027E5AA47|nr:alkaline phosphatase family protein [Glaciibacter superstes]